MPSWTCTATIVAPIRHVAFQYLTKPASIKLSSSTALTSGLKLLEVETRQMAKFGTGDLWMFDELESQQRIERSFSLRFRCMTCKFQILHVTSVLHPPVFPIITCRTCMHQCSDHTSIRREPPANKFAIRDWFVGPCMCVWVFRW